MHCPRPSDGEDGVKVVVARFGHRVIVEASGGAFNKSVLEWEESACEPFWDDGDRTTEGGHDEVK